MIKNKIKNMKKIGIVISVLIIAALGISAFLNNSSKGLEKSEIVADSIPDLDSILEPEINIDSLAKMDSAGLKIK